MATNDVAEERNQYILMDVGRWS